MPQSPKIFIYNGLGTAEPLVADLKELLTVNNIFPEKPDVTTCDFSFNPEGLSKPMLVVPGGSTSVIGLKIQSQMAKFKSLFDENFHYLGVCAGAFLGANDADLFLATHEYDKKSGELKDPEFFISTKSIKVNFSAIDDVNACGAFYPHDKYFKNERGKKYMPYRVSLQLNSNEKINQVYLAGPGFFKQHTEQKSEVVATYSDKESYQFSYENEKKEFKQFTKGVIAFGIYHLGKFKLDVLWATMFEEK